MIVTRKWLEEFVDLRGIEDEKLYETFNSIGLEVDSLISYRMPEKVVVGRVVACEKHPDADKLNLCRIDVGEAEPLQIVCGAANVREAEFVPVAVVGAVLPGDFAIRPAKLRGVESYGMVCSAAELGLPEMGEGILILDESVGAMVPGMPLSQLESFNDTVIELELTANRGDCLSIRGVARDLSAALDRELIPHTHQPLDVMRRGIARILDLHTRGPIEADLLYTIVESESLRADALMRLRLGLVGEYRQGDLEALLAYATHATGVLLQAYDAQKLQDEKGKITLEILQPSPGIVEIRTPRGLLGIVGAWADEAFTLKAGAQEILLEASYIDPELLVPAVAREGVETDGRYYRSSRGSEPDLKLGLSYLSECCDRVGVCRFSESPLIIEASREPRRVSVDTERLNAMIGQPIPKGRIHTILRRLGFAIHGAGAERFSVTVPPWRHDIVNLQDLAEEILRIVGINNIEARPLELTEANRLTESTRRFRIRRDLRQRAVAAGFFEAVTYAFTEREKLERYGFETIEAPLDLLNPIVEELNTLRSTLTINLLEAARRNLSYGKRRIPLFEIGSVFDARRQERERVCFLWCGEREEPGVLNQGKPPRIDFPHFIQLLGSLLGPFELRPCRENNGLIHPYQSATLWLHGREAGWVSTLHPSVAQELGLEATLLAELDFEALIPPHRNARPVSNFQGTFKDLSLLVDRELPYARMQEVLERMEEPLIRRFFPIDRYEDEKLGAAKSMTLRFFLQSEEGTLSDEAIEGVMERVLSSLAEGCGARLR